ncbi:MAG: NUDIX domain-containing protein [Candidatus Aenigmarchaeota archaeon]|nr:NUDIX domain-containing protein [Candidatus Aenigmarchaeota archaeon]
MILHDTVSAVIEKEGRILLVKRLYQPERNYWAVPGGHVDKGETLLEAIVRECKEEVGTVHITPNRPLFTFTHDAKLGHRHRAHLFRGMAAGSMHARSDAQKLGWFTLKQMQRMNLTHYTKKILNKLYARVL